MQTKNICNNCGKQGHQFHQCKLPITSYGVILYRNNLNEHRGIEYLMIRRKDSFGYIDFIRGKYSQNNLDHLTNIFNEMTVTERQRVQELDFQSLWKMMWGDSHIGSQYRSEEISSQKKFECLQTGFEFNGQIISIDYLVSISHTKWNDSEWEFPKGRKNFNEKDIECAIREFSEETGIDEEQICIIDNLLPFEEIFIGSNHKAYKHKYFIACKKNNSVDLDNYQRSEVSKIEWKTLDECLNSIRPYNLEKKKLIMNINKIINGHIYH
jgi:8-oxo-dGTP pyrophosphatase MutT (NUDIX family)